MISTPVLVAFALVAAATSFLAGILGMAGGMILMGVLLLVMPVPAAMILHAVTQMSSNGWRAALWIRYVDWPILARYCVGLLVTLAGFAAIAFVPDRAVVLLLLGLSPFAALALPERMAIRVDRRLGAEACGVICSALQYLSGVSGPILDLFFVRTELDRRTVVATKAACQVITHVSRLIYFGGLTGVDTDLGWPIFAVAVVSAIAGTSLSRTVLERMTDTQFRVWTRRVVLGLGAVFVLQALYEMAKP